MPCTSLTRTGKPCRARPLHGTDHCMAHSSRETQALVGFGGAENGVLGGRPRKPPIPIARQLIEENVDVLLGPHFAALGCKVVLDSEGAHLERIPGSGAKLYGEAKSSGEIVLSPYDDIGAQQAAAERLLDRVYGKAKQQTEVSGPEGSPIRLASTFDLERLTLDERRALLELVEKAADGSSAA